MSDDNKLVPQVGGEGPTSTAEEILQALHEHHQPSNGDDDVLTNPELEQLVGSVSKGLEEGFPDSELGGQAAALLTLEDLARGESVVCANCGSANPTAARFCGMCGRDLAHSSTAGKLSREDGERPGAVQTAPEAVASRPKTVKGTSSSQGWKIATLMLLGFVLGLVISQQRWWLSRNVITSLITVPAPAPQVIPTAPANVPAKPAPAPVERSLPPVRPPNPGPKPTRPVSPPAVSSTGGPASKAAPAAASPAAPSPSVANRESPEGAPLVHMAVSPIELPTVIKPPSQSPVLAGTQAPAPDSSSPSTPRIAQVSPGALIYKVNPWYPPAARSARVQGAVVMQATIAADGTVQQLKLVSGNPLLVNAAMAAVRKWRYRPYLLDGKPVEVETTITVNFKGE